MGASKNLEFAQMQGVEKISPRRIWVICKQEIILRASATRLACLPLCRNAAVGMKSGFLEVPLCLS
jgi:hypothetical protein